MYSKSRGNLRMSPGSEVITLSRNAMATRFELVLCDDDASRLRAAGEEALDEVERLHDRLSAFSPQSEVSYINSHAADQPVRISPDLFSLIQTCRRIHDESRRGAFDITVAPLMNCWGFVNGEGRTPTEQDLSKAGELVGMDHILLDETAQTIRFDREGVRIDLGAIGKGYAVQRAANILREVGVTCALIHGGTSSVYAIGSPPDGHDWRVAIRHPAEPGEILAVVGLKDTSLSVSAVHGKSFTLQGTEYGHVIDPRTRMPSQAAVLAAVVSPDAAEGDALSTALLVLGKKWLPRLIEESKGMKGLVASRTASCIEVSKLGTATSH